MAAIRRLAAILAADVAGYSRLMGADEGGTLRALKLVRADLVDPEIAEHNGRLVKTTGDGLLVEFSSVVDALRCATEVQRGMVERNTLLPMDNRIEFRIGAKLRAAGKTGKQALVACMRKLVVILNAILRDRKPWQPA
jgi:adenylate cyclase